MLALGAGHGVLLATDGREWGPIATAAAIAAGLRADGPYDLVLFGNEAADTGDYQVPVRLAHALGLPWPPGSRTWVITGGVRGPAGVPGHRGGLSLALPAVISVKEGINLPRYPSLPGRLRAKRAAVERPRRSYGRRATQGTAPGAARREQKAADTRHGADAVPALVRVLEEWGVLS